MTGSLSGCLGAEFLFGEAYETQCRGAEERDGGWVRKRWGCGSDGGRGECRRAGGDRAARGVGDIGVVCEAGGWAGEAEVVSKKRRKGAGLGSDSCPEGRGIER